MSLELVLNAVDIIQNSESHDIECGSYCQFLRSPIDRKWGYKMYQTAMSLDIAFRNQAWAAKFGLSPKVGRKFIARNSDGRLQFGYLTECVDICLSDYAFSKAEEKTGIEYSYRNECGNEYENIVYGIENSLIKRIQDIGLTFSDSHSYNIGAKLNKNGKPIKWLAIDLNIEKYNGNDEQYYSL